MASIFNFGLDICRYLMCSGWLLLDNSVQYWWWSSWSGIWGIYYRQTSEKVWSPLQVSLSISTSKSVWKSILDYGYNQHSWCLQLHLQLWPSIWSLHTASLPWPCTTSLLKHGLQSCSLSSWRLCLPTPEPSALLSSSLSWTSLQVRLSWELPHNVLTLFRNNWYPDRTD